MGWPKKNEEARIYFERGPKTYLIVFLPAMQHNGCYEAVGELMINNDPDNPKLCSTSVSPMHLYRKCCRVQWSDMPEVWQEAHKNSINCQPEEIRGFWKVKK